jgi:hypothetical protein
MDPPEIFSWINRWISERSVGDISKIHQRSLKDPPEIYRRTTKVPPSFELAKVV